MAIIPQTKGKIQYTAYYWAVYLQRQNAMNKGDWAHKLYAGEWRGDYASRMEALCYLAYWLYKSHHSTRIVANMLATCQLGRGIPRIELETIVSDMRPFKWTARQGELLIALVSKPLATCTELAKEVSKWEPMDRRIVYKCLLRLQKEGVVIKTGKRYQLADTFRANWLIFVVTGEAIRTVHNGEICVHKCGLLEAIHNSIEYRVSNIS